MTLVGPVECPCHRIPSSESDIPNAISYCDSDRYISKRRNILQSSIGQSRIDDENRRNIKSSTTTRGWYWNNAHEWTHRHPTWYRPVITMVPVRPEDDDEKVAPPLSEWWWSSGLPLEDHSHDAGWDDHGPRPTSS